MEKKDAVNLNPCCDSIVNWGWISIVCVVIGSHQDWWCAVVAFGEQDKLFLK